jgi:hypothetical protein
VTGDPKQQPDESRFKPMTLALAGVAVLAAGLTLIPPTYRPWNLSALGALGLFAAARLGFWQAVAIFGVGLGVKELGAYVQYGMAPHPPTWACYAGYVLLGYLLLRRTESPVRIGATAVSASLLFFLFTNFGAWLEQAYPYGYTFEGLINCYNAAIPFYRGTLAGDLVFTAGLFAAHAALSRAYFPAERVAAVVAEPTREEGQW